MSDSEYYSVFLLGPRNLPVNSCTRLNLQEATLWARRWARDYPRRVYVLCHEGRTTQYLTPDAEYSSERVMW